MKPIAVDPTEHGEASYGQDVNELRDALREAKEEQAAKDMEIAETAGK